jgi:lysophospholipase L1-like esterase
MTQRHVGIGAQDAVSAFMRSTRVTALVALALLSSLCATQPALSQQLPDPKRFEADIQKFEAQDRVEMPPEGAVVLTGSSSIARWSNQAQAALAPLTVIPRGFGGSVMHDVRHYLDRVALVYKPRAILIYEGDNDTGLNPPIPKDSIVDDLRQIIARVHEKLPQTRIYVLSVKPSVARLTSWSRAQAVNVAFREIADSDPLVYYVDVATPLQNDDGTVMTDIFISDNLHLNDLGNTIWGSAIRAALMPREARFEKKK